MSTEQTFGWLLREARKQSGLTQADVAEVVGCSQKQISNYEHGNRFPGFAEVINCYQALRMNHQEAIALVNAMLVMWSNLRIEECVCDGCLSVHLDECDCDECRDTAEIG